LPIAKLNKSKIENQKSKIQMIVTLSEMKAELGIADAADDAALTQFMAALDGRFDSFLHRSLARGAGVIEYFDGGGRMLLLDRFPVESVASVNVSAVSDWSDATLLDAADYRLNKLRGRIVYGARQSPRDESEPWPSGVQNIRVVYTGGFVSAGEIPAAGQAAMPQEIRGAYFMQAGFEWRNRTHLGQASVSAQGASVALAPARLLPEVQDILNRSEWKRI
jgi:hypothetical protein